MTSAEPIGSLAHLSYLAMLDPILSRHIQRSTVTTYEAFLECLNHDFDDACRMLQERHDQYHDKKEDLITSALVISLASMGYNATHDTKVGGHVDVVVRGKKPAFLWLGEAKRDTSLAWIGQGFDQLCERYATGDEIQNNGALIIYCQKGNAADCLARWEVKLKELALPAFKSEACPSKPRLAFISEHKLRSSGTPYIVRHVAVNLKYK